ncbi:MAG: hypothetical protein ACI9OO_000080 [Bacteroidia bacterium]|jgi:hypothetical protein
MDGHWEPLEADLAKVLRVCIRNLDSLEPGFTGARWWRKAGAQLEERNTRRHARINVNHH